MLGLDPGLRSSQICPGHHHCLWGSTLPHVAQDPAHLRQSQASFGSADP